MKHLSSRQPPADAGGFHQVFPRWHVFARARFTLRPDYVDRVFVWGANIRSAQCSLKGEGQVTFERPLHSPILRAYIQDTFSPLLLLEVTRYGVKFKTLEWKFEHHHTEEFVFEDRAAPH